MSPARVVLLTLVVVLLVVVFFVEAAVVSSSAAANADAAREPITAFLCADSGDYSGAHELGFLQKALEEREALPLSPCQSAYRGFIRHADGITRTPALVVTTGIGYVSAALCTRRVMTWENATPNVVLTKFIWIGTAGFSPMVGGWDPTNTSVFRHEEAALKALEAARDAPSAPQETTSADTRAATEPRPPLTPAEYAAHVAATRAAEPRTVAPPLLRHANFELFESEMQLDADGCSPRMVPTTASSASSRSAPHAQPLAIGSICVTSSAFLQESAYCTETAEASQCSRPHCFGFARATINHYMMDNTLAREIVAASAGKAFPPVPEAVREGMRQFWYANDAAVPAEDDASSTLPAAESGSEDDRRERARRAVGDMAATLTPSFVQCAESTMNAIFVGAERDYLCREHTADVLTQLATQQRRPRRVYTADEVVCVQAMEAFGFLQSVATRAPDRAIAVIRTASNYDMYPQQKLYLSNAHVERLRQADATRRTDVDNTSSSATSPSTSSARALRAHGWTPLGPETRTALETWSPTETANSNVTEVVSAYVWSQNTGYVSAAEYDAFVMASFHYSVKTATFVLSNYFFGGRDFTVDQN